MEDKNVEAKIRAISNDWMSFAELHARGTAAWIESEADNACDSPIEKLFFVAWSTLQHKFALTSAPSGLGCCLVSAGYGAGKGEQYKRRDDVNPWQVQPHLPDQIDHLVAQQKIGPYRVDFVVHRTIRHGVRQEVYRTPHVIVECDGHDFHERTKEQAQRDRERDRYLQGEGYAVVRFTGSEIWRKPMGCAEQLEFFLQQKIAAATKQEPPKDVKAALWPLEMVSE